MKSRDFCYWLQGYFEIEKERAGSLGQIGADSSQARQMPRVRADATEGLIHSDFRPFRNPMTFARISLLLPLLLSACSVPVSGAIEHLSNSLESHCGWFKSPGVPPDDACHVLVAQDGAALSRVEDDPCDVPPVPELLVKPGEPHAEWHRFNVEYTVLIEPCHN